MLIHKLDLYVCPTCLLFFKHPIYSFPLCTLTSMCSIDLDSSLLLLCSAVAKLLLNLSTRDLFLITQTLTLTYFNIFSGLS